MNSTGGLVTRSGETWSTMMSAIRRTGILSAVAGRP
jgi:hypothetical protein